MQHILLLVHLAVKELIGRKQTKCDENLYNCLFVFYLEANTEPKNRVNDREKTLQKKENRTFRYKLTSKELCRW